MPAVPPVPTSIGPVWSRPCVINRLSAIALATAVHSHKPVLPSIYASDQLTDCAVQNRDGDIFRSSHTNPFRRMLH